MTLMDTRWLASAACSAFLISCSVSGCSDDSTSHGGTGGTAGTAGMGDGGIGGDGGTGGAGGKPIPPQAPGLWEGRNVGVDVCFYISDDGLTLAKNPDCSLSGESAYSFDLQADLGGIDENGQRCSFELRYDKDVTIDQERNSFRASAEQPPGSGVTLSFSGELVREMASGIAQREEGDSTCRASWGTSVSNECDEDAKTKCEELLDCCRAILVSPVFFQSCSSVVELCDMRRCQEVLDGYEGIPQCEPEP